MRRMRFATSAANAEAANFRANRSRLYLQIYAREESLGDWRSLSAGQRHDGRPPLPRNEISLRPFVDGLTINGTAARRFRQGVGYLCPPSKTFNQLCMGHGVTIR